MHMQALSLPTAVRAFAPLLPGVTPAQWLTLYNARASLLAAGVALPSNVHLTTIHVHNATTLLLRLAHT
jgi:hypothetical protein